MAQSSTAQPVAASATSGPLPTCVAFILALLAAARVYFRSRTDTALEVLALRQQVAAQTEAAQGIKADLRRHRDVAAAPGRTTDLDVKRCPFVKKRPVGSQNRIHSRGRTMQSRLRDSAHP